MRTSRFTAVALAIAALLALGALPVLAAPHSRAAAERAAHQRVVGYWTGARQAAAQARDFEQSKGQFQPVAKQQAAKGPAAVKGASWTKGGRVAVAVGKVFFSMDGGNWTCSGSVLTDHRSDVSLVLTAAHCAYDETNGAFATNWMFIPAWGSAPTRNCASTVYGCWTASALVVHEGYATAGGFNTQATVHDFAVAVVGPGGKSGSSQLDTVAGSFDLVAANSVANGTFMYAFGYPAAGKYNGNVLTYCSGKIAEDTWNARKTWGLACDMTGGSSGGGWFADFNEATGVGMLGSLNSYKYNGLANKMFGPKFNLDTADVYAAADATTANTIVP